MGRTALQKVWNRRNRLKKWADKKLMRFSKNKHKAWMEYLYRMMQIQISILKSLNFFLMLRRSEDKACSLEVNGNSTIAFRFFSTSISCRLSIFSVLPAVVFSLAHATASIILSLAEIFGQRSALHLFPYFLQHKGKEVSCIFCSPLNKHLATVWEPLVIDM